MIHHPVTTLVRSSAKKAAASSRATLARPQAFWAVAAALGATILGNNIPAPLYPLYQSAWHFSTGVSTLIFAVVAVGVIPSLLIFGALSDRLGRRPMLLLGLALATVATLVFIFAQGVGWLLVARLLQGCAFGAMIGNATAALTELEPAHNGPRALFIATTITVASQAIGPLLTGFLAAYAPWPLRLIFVLLLVVVVASFIGLWFIPETHTQVATSQSRGFGVPRAALLPFVLATLAVLSAFGMVGIIAATGPILAKTVLHVRNAALSGVIVFFFLGASAVAQLLNRGQPYRALLLVGPGILALSALGLSLALGRGSVPFFVLTILLAGVGQGLTYLGSQELVGAVATEETRGSIFSVFNVVVYVGASATALGCGFGAAALGLAGAAQVVLASVAIVALQAGILAIWTAGLQPLWFSAALAAKEA